MAESQLVTVAGINKVWSATMALYNKLDHRLDNIGRVFKFKKSFVKWTDSDSSTEDFVHYSGNDLYPINLGDVISVNEGYLQYTKDPSNYPAWTPGKPGRLFICITASSNKPTYTDTGNEWETYWTPIDLNLQVASDSQYGVIKIGFNESGTYSSFENPKAVKLYNGDAYVDIPTSASGTKGLVEVVKYDTVQTVSPLKCMDGGLSLKIDGLNSDSSNDGVAVSLPSAGEWRIQNTGLISGKTKANGGTSGTVYFNKGKTDGSNQEEEVPVYGWSDKQDKSNAVTTSNNDTLNPNQTSVGLTTKPVWVEKGVVKEITSISLSTSGTDNVASFSGSSTAGAAGKSVVSISGPAAGSSTDADPGNTVGGTAKNVALQVSGAVRVIGGLSATKVYHAVWNDISDAIEVQDTLKTDPGYCYFFDGKEYHRTSKYCQKGIIGIHSDTAGSVLGKKGKHKELDISVGGFVLAYVDKEYAPGTPLTSAPNGRLTKMSLISRILHPERLVATYWKKETNKEWGDESHKVEVNGRHWVKVR